MPSTPETRYAKSGDLHVAYQVVGDGPFDLLHIPGFVSNVEGMWDEPLLARFLGRLASFSRLILFDKRGTGLSDRVPVDRLPTLEERMDDLRAVLDAAGSEQAALLSHSEGGNLAVLYAATYPERTRALVTTGMFAARIWSPDYPWAPKPEERERRSRGRALADEHADRRPRRSSDDHRPHARHPPHGRPGRERRGGALDREPDPGRALSRAARRGPPAVGRRPGPPPRRGGGVPDRHTAGARARPRPRDRSLHGHRRLDGAGRGARRP